MVPAEATAVAGVTAEAVDSFQFSTGMDIIKLTERAMSMDDSTWQRHANPWSVYTRFTILPLLSLAFWSREWIGIYATAPILLSLLWIWLNPRAFPIPRNTHSWASMGTFGERIYLQRKSIEIPAHHLRAARTLALLTALGLPVLIYGIYHFDLRLLILGNLWITFFKAWFVDRMVWLYLDLKDSNPRFRSWLRIT